jgi:hypothetical protein
VSIRVGYAGSQEQATRALRLKGQDLVGSGADLDNFRRSYPFTVNNLQGLVGRPPGNRARLSDIDRDFVIPELGEEIPNRWDPDALHFLGVVPNHDLGRIAGQDDADVVTDLDRPVRSEMKRYRRRGSVVSTSSGYVHKLHRSPFLHDHLT